MGIRRAVRADLPRIWEIRYAVRENPLSPGQVTDADCDWFLDNSGFWLWEEHGVVCGFSASDTRNGTVWAMFVDPAHEGRGIGRALFEAALIPLREAGYTRATLSTDPGTRAEAFYRRAGWTAGDLNDAGEVSFISPPL
jgi:GNAT superfamily N-acetyltransferase